MRESQTNLASDVLLDLGSAGPGPLHERLKQALRRAIRAGRIGPGSALPPSRRLAADLGCSRWAVTEAYSQLVAEGYLAARTGSATRVRWQRDAAQSQRRPSAGPAPRARYDLAPGLPDLRAFPRRPWADAIRAQLATVPYLELGYPAPAGHPELRGLLADYLRRARGAVATADDITLCTSVTDAVWRICRALRDANIHTLACEEPGWTRLREVARRSGLSIVSIRTDERGLRVADLARQPGLRAVLTTPAHQFPGGMVLAPERRAALLQWAREVDGVVIEDDYDAEFRYDRRPVATVQGMDPTRVILLKSLSKVLSPALGIGWIVAPPPWTEALRGAGTPISLPSTLDQLAFGTLLSSGAYDRHLRRCLLLYRARRDALVRALADRLPNHRVCGIAAGLHLVLHLPGRVDPTAVVAAAATRSVDVVALSRYHATSEQPEHGLVLGYGNLADGTVDEAVQHLTAAIRDAT
jgi:GntR family transcriptional regulator/MocR family aminotransferase